MFLNDKRKQDAVWCLDYSRHVAEYGMTYTQYRRYRNIHGRTPPKVGNGKGRTSSPHRGC